MYQTKGTILAGFPGQSTIGCTHTGALGKNEDSSFLSREPKFLIRDAYLMRLAVTNRFIYRAIINKMRRADSDRLAVY
jgi:hypothetical protein